MGKLMIDINNYRLLSPKDEAILLSEQRLAELEPDNIFIGIDYANGLFGDKSIKTKAKLLDDGKIEIISVEEFDCEKDISDTIISFKKKSVATIHGSSNYLKKLLNEGKIKFTDNEKLLKELNKLNRQ